MILNHNGVYTSLSKVCDISVSFLSNVLKLRLGVIPGWDMFYVWFQSPDSCSLIGNDKFDEREMLSVQFDHNVGSLVPVAFVPPNPIFDFFFSSFCHWDYTLTDDVRVFDGLGGFVPCLLSGFANKYESDSLVPAIHVESGVVCDVMLCDLKDDSIVTQFAIGESYDWDGVDLMRLFQWSRAFGDVRSPMVSALTCLKPCNNTVVNNTCVSVCLTARLWCYHRAVLNVMSLMPPGKSVLFLNYTPADDRIVMSSNSHRLVCHVDERSDVPGVVRFNSLQNGHHGLYDLVVIGTSPVSIPMRDEFYCVAARVVKSGCKVLSLVPNHERECLLNGHGSGGRARLGISAYVYEDLVDSSFSLFEPPRVKTIANKEGFRPLGYEKKALRDLGLIVFENGPLNVFAEGSGYFNPPLGPLKLMGVDIRMLTILAGENGPLVIPLMTIRDELSRWRIVASCKMGNMSDTVHENVVYFAGLGCTFAPDRREVEHGQFGSAYLNTVDQAKKLGYSNPLHIPPGIYGKDYRPLVNLDLVADRFANVKSPVGRPHVLSGFMSSCYIVNHARLRRKGKWKGGNLYGEGAYYA